jgi:hypothetical protein
MTDKVATCHCGALKLTCNGAPMTVVMCHCEDCQRRTGSSYNLGAWYEKSSVTIEGSEKVFNRTGEEGMDLAYHFCPECGSNVYWEASTMEAAYGVAGGCFADPDFPRPSFSIYGKRRHKWLDIPESIPCYISKYGEEPQS